jgi:hypothetical protein
MNLFARLLKVDEARQEVTGRIAREEPDASQEIMDYETSKPLFRAWSESFHAATGGMSKGNVRAMHGKVAAGKLTEISFDDEQKAVDVVAHIVDAAEWEKCLKGVYTGFSIGGSYAKRWEDGELMRYTAKPSEVSLVDNPCIKSARFSLVKSDGTVEEMELGKTTEAPAPAPEVAPDGPSFADLAKYAGEEVFDARMAIEALASILYLFDKESTEDHPEAAAQLANLGAVIRNLKAFIASEIMEAQPTGGAPEMLMMAKAVMVMAKAGARNSKPDSERIQGIHDHSVSLGAACAAAKAEKGEGDSMGKAELEQELTKRDEEITGLKKTVGDLTGELTAVKEKLTKLEAEPAPGGPAARAVPVEKGADTDIGQPSGPTEAEMVEKNDTVGLLKLAHQKPFRIGG